MTERHFNLVVPLPHKGTEMRIEETAGSAPEWSYAVSQLNNRLGDVDSTMATPGFRTSTTATRTTTTRTTTTAPGPSADWNGQADFPTVAALFVRGDSIYKTIQGVDAWDIERDARRWPGGGPAVAHPPCRAWGRLRNFAKPRPDEKEMALWAVEQIRRHGGILEHPAGSTLWAAAGLPAPGSRDKFGGWTLPVNQHWWGHRAEKATWLYIVGAEPGELPPIPFRIDEPTHVVQSRKRVGHRPHITKAEREHTPPLFAHWLVSVARICGGHK